MKRKILSWSEVLGDTVGGAAIGFFGAMFTKPPEDAKDFYMYGFIGAGALIGLLLGLNSYTIIDTDEDILSYSIFGLIRRKIKLSDIENIEPEVETKYDDKGKATYSYRLVFYGPFGTRKVSFSNKNEMNSVANALGRAMMQ
jgi:hypothetical protein